MNICFTFEGLFPGTSRAARHVEALARRFAVKGHRVSVVTTSFPEERSVEGIETIRLSHVPSGPADKDERLHQKTISRHLKQWKTDILFAESLTPLSALAVRAAGECHISTIVRVLADRDGIVHGFGAGRRLSPRSLEKRISTLLEHATAAAASSDRCAQLLRRVYTGPIHIVEKCVDLNLFRRGRTTRRDLDAFRTEHDVLDRPILFYARERLRESTPAELFPILKHLQSRGSDFVFGVMGELAGNDFVAAAKEAGVASHVRWFGTPDSRGFFAAYEAASVFLVPPSSRASAREILEAMAMGLAVVCFPETAASAAQAVVPDETGLVLSPDDPEVAARELADLLQDPERLERLREGAFQCARRHDLIAAIEKVEGLCTQILGRSVLPQEPAPSEPAAAGEELEEETSKREEAMKDNDVDGIEDRGSEREDEETPARSRGGSTRRGRRRESPAAETPSDDLVWDEEAEDEGAQRFDPDSEEGVESVGAEQEDDSGKDPKRRGRERRRRRRRGASTPEVEELGASTGIDVLEVSSARPRRARSIEPGLTLKDLLPFLRPPKTVLVLGASTGNGHNRTASALVEAFKGVDQNLVVRGADVLDLVDKAHRSSDIKALLERLSRSPLLFGTPFETLESSAAERDPTSELDEVMSGLFKDKMNQIVVDKKPDHLVLTHWLPLRHLEALKAEEKLAAPVSVVIPDPALHERWVSSVVDHYLVPDENMKARLQTRGVDAALISVTGIPVSPSFAHEVDVEGLHRDLGLRRETPTVLLRPGGVGTTERILACVQRLVEACAPVNLLVLAGKNDRLREDLTKMEAVRGSVVRPFGFIQNIHELMAVSDLLITRASPHTIAEARASGLPLVLLRPSPGVEDHMADDLLAAGVAKKAYDETDLVFTVSDLLRNRRMLRDMRDAAERCKKPDATSQAISRLCRLVK